MHHTAMINGKYFFDVYLGEGANLHLVEIGSQDMNGSLRQVCPPAVKYTGLDFVPGRGVDVVIEDPYKLPLADESVDVIVSSSCFEHSEMFWLVFGEILRVLKPKGLFYLNVPSNGTFHQHPVDCWRFYPDSGKALVTWGRRCGYKPALLESFTTAQYKEFWNDFVGVFLKDEAFAAEYPGRIVSHHDSFFNAHVYGHEGVLKREDYPEDMRRIGHLNRRIEVMEQQVKQAAAATPARQPDAISGIANGGSTQTQLDAVSKRLQAVERRLGLC